MRRASGLVLVLGVWCGCWVWPAVGDFGAFGHVPCPSRLQRERLCVDDAGPVVYEALGKIGEDPLPFNETLSYVRQLLQEAVMVEHSTIPLYLTSLFSMKSSYVSTTSVTDDELAATATASSDAGLASSTSAALDLDP